ncbi:DNA-binding FadR family transcriptional regulator [Caldalkalibacillus uzonensis]|uniref:DNA-binding FadR family transcriptional regulator n=1 Tax=Caldalkalibacillus uzonensis TaxID=353224 RepID=A0ABU0CPL6_9BACI|nr:FadR/GntR family transcriptional regulator [Caldalkalibacillus uzonensis]MDQ0338364.1 DNA-binding FadR family transcriptional regulator [Caldalkalibacillus uzonensis]
MAPRNLSEQLLHDIGQQIVNEELLPGDILPKVEVLSEIKGVSRTVVREALKGLIARRLVESSTKVGTVVRDRSDWQWWDPDVLLWASRSKKKRQFLLQITEVRLAIEPSAVKLAAKNATDEDIRHIQKCYQRLEETLGNDEEWVKADYEFHNSILMASHNEIMFSLVKTLHIGLFQSRQETIRALKEDPSPSYGEPSEEVLARHKSVMDAICARDENLAYQKMYELLMRVVELIERRNDGENI